MAQTKKPRPEATPSLRDRSEVLRARVADDRPVDPVHAVIREGRKLLAALLRARELPTAHDGQPPQAMIEAVNAVIDHLRGPIMETPPETPVGAVALAKYVTELPPLSGYNLEHEIYAILDAIAGVRVQ